MDAPATFDGGFLRSCLAIDIDRGARASLETVRHWLAEERRAAVMRVSRIPLREMDAWSFTESAPLRLLHRSGRFFAVEGARFHSPSTGEVWEQPILNQPEAGLLGFLVTAFEGVPHFLVQAKWEPGNRALQLSPTVQATHSNYTRAHGGREQPYLDQFFPPRPEHTLFDTLMPEHGSYFRRKYNRNMVVRVPADLPVRDGFCWVTLGQIKALIGEDDVVHMDSRSVLGCLALAAPDDDRLSSELDQDARASAIARSAGRRDGIAELERWLAGPPVDVQPRSLDALAGWVIDEDAIRPARQSAGDFSIIAVRVEASRREIATWTQPLIAPASEGFLGLITTHDEDFSLLVEARPEPGHDGTHHVFPTVTSEDVESAPLAALFRGSPGARSVFSAQNSEEGGRFFQFDNRYRIIELPKAEVGPLPATHRWVTLGQLAELGKRGRVSMELRNLLAALPVSTRP